MNGTLTPASTPTGITYLSFAVPRDTEWYGLFAGAITLLVRDYYWRERPSGLTIPQTIAVWNSYLWTVP